MKREREEIRYPHERPGPLDVKLGANDEAVVTVQPRSKFSTITRPLLQLL